MNLFKLTKATTRNTPSHWVTIGGVRVLFSYETAMAFEYKDNRFRRPNDWGPTTTKHLREAGVSGYPELPTDQFEAALASHIINTLKGE